MLNYDPKKDKINPKRCQLCVQRLEEKKSDVIFHNLHIYHILEVLLGLIRTMLSISILSANFFLHLIPSTFILQNPCVIKRQNISCLCLRFLPTKGPWPMIGHNWSRDLNTGL